MHILVSVRSAVCVSPGDLPLHTNTQSHGHPNTNTNAILGTNIFGPFFRYNSFSHLVFIFVPPALPTNYITRILYPKQLKVDHRPPPRSNNEIILLLLLFILLVLRSNFEARTKPERFFVSPIFFLSDIKWDNEKNRTKKKKSVAEKRNYNCPGKWYA